MKKKLLFIISEDWAFISHRLDLACDAIDNGYEVAILCKSTGQKERISSKGIKVFDWHLSRGSLDPFTELKSIINIINCVSEYKPDLVHAVALKPVLYSTIVGQLNRKTPIICALGGLGFVFSSKSLKASILRKSVSFFLRGLFSRSNIFLILQNRDDRGLLIEKKITRKDKVRLIRGAGVDIEVFAPLPDTNRIPVVALPARFLWDKGLGDFVEAARRIKSEGISARFVLLGMHDQHNPESIKTEIIDAWVSEGIIENWGYQKNMEEILPRTSIVCLPSSREGLPKALLEAASCGRAIVTYDVPGCREVVDHEKNGLLVRFNDVDGLTDALKLLILDGSLREDMGARGRLKAVNEFSREIITRQTLTVWEEALADNTA